jgi:putative colanic acid biosynthesis UDP-glucose lipid carrier transferase
MSRVSEELLSQISSNFTATRESHAPYAGALQRGVRPGTIDPGSVLLLKWWINPTVVVFTLIASTVLSGGAMSTAYVALMLVAGLLTAQLVRPPNFDKWIADPASAHKSVLRTLSEWTTVVAILFGISMAMKIEHLFSHEIITTWVIATGVNLAAAHWASARVARWISASAESSQRHIVVGINDVGVEFVRRMQNRACTSQFMGYFDFRDAKRLSGSAVSQLKGHASEVAQYVRDHGIHSVYIAVPISNAARIQELLGALRDTTASVYFVPDMFSFDVVQPRFVDINGMPALSVTETPFQGMCGVRKRVLDAVLALLAIAVLSPVLLLIVIAVRLSSPGPIIFKQKRYGLNGEEIVVFKFRSMRVCENGSNVVQATRGDKRLTPIGTFLRKTSLDELPQIFNVLFGTMSFVGPRPHAVAHNEQYRKIISGYMIRHKVRPGITGWAQVHGLRGETDTLDKMEQRVRYDLEYLRHWSLWLDVKIIFKTLWMVLKRENAY